MCSTKRLSLEILENLQKSIGARVSLSVQLKPLDLLIVLLNSIAHAVPYW